MKLKQHLTIIIFVLVCTLLSVYSLFGRFDSSNYDIENEVATSQEDNKIDDKSIFTNINYFLSSNHQKTLELVSTELILSDENSILKAQNPDGILYRNEQDKGELSPIKFKSLYSHGLISAQELHLENEVEVSVDNARLKSNFLDIYKGGKLIEANGNVDTLSIDKKTNDQLMIKSQQVVYKPDDEFFEYKTDVTGSILRKRKYEEGIDFSADKIALKGKESLLELDGKVAINKGNLKATSNKGTVYLENYNKRLKYYSLSDDVRLEESFILNGEKMSRKAFSEKLEGIISEDMIIMTGLPKVFQGRDVIKGNRIVIRENVETVEVDDANTNIIIDRRN